MSLMHQLTSTEIVTLRCLRLDAEALFGKSFQSSGIKWSPWALSLPPGIAAWKTQSWDQTEKTQSWDWTEKVQSWDCIKKTTSHINDSFSSDFDHSWRDKNHFTSNLEIRCINNDHNIKYNSTANRKAHCYKEQSNLPTNSVSASNKFESGLDEGPSSDRSGSIAVGRKHKCTLTSAL